MSVTPTYVLRKPYTDGSPERSPGRRWIEPIMRQRRQQHSLTAGTDAGPSLGGSFQRKSETAVPYPREGGKPSSHSANSICWPDSSPPEPGLLCQSANRARQSVTVQVRDMQLVCFMFIHLKRKKSVLTLVCGAQRCCIDQYMVADEAS